MVGCILGNLGCGSFLLEGVNYKIIFLFFIFLVNECVMLIVIFGFLFFK